MRAKVPSLRASLAADDATFRRVYMFTYTFARTPGQKALPQDAAAEYWKLLLGSRFAHQLPAWIDFLEKVYRKSITKDTWNCMYDFVLLAQRDPELVSYDVDGKCCASWVCLGGGGAGLIRRVRCLAVDFG